MTGIGKLYNPHQGNVNALSSVAESSGFAKPLIMATMGREARSAQDFSTQMNNEQTAMKALEVATKLAETDPIMANKVLEMEAQNNPAAKQLLDTGIRFSGRGKKPWQVMTNQKTGEIFHFNLDAWIADGGKPDDVDKYKKTISKGEVKKTAPKTRTRNVGDQTITEEWNGKEWVQVGDKSPRWKPEDKDGSGIGKVGHINQVRQSTVQHFLDKIPDPRGDKELQAAVKDILNADPYKGEVNVTKFINVLDKDTRKQFQDVMAKAESYVTKMSPENAVQKAIEEVLGDEFKSKLKPTTKKYIESSSPGGSFPLGEYSDFDKTKQGRRPLSNFHVPRRKR